MNIGKFSIYVSFFIEIFYSSEDFIIQDHLKHIFILSVMTFYEYVPNYGTKICLCI